MFRCKILFGHAIHDPNGLVNILLRAGRIAVPEFEFSRRNFSLSLRESDPAGVLTMIRACWFAVRVLIPRDLYV